MNDKVFLDTNIIIYAHSDHDVPKQIKAQKIIIDQNTIVSTQVLQETVNVLNKKSKLPWSDINEILMAIGYNNVIHSNTEQTILSACNIAEKFKFSFYDCIIIAAALEAEATILYSEDMNHGQVIENRLRIVNPFK